MSALKNKTIDTNGIAIKWEKHCHPYNKCLESVNNLKYPRLEYEELLLEAINEELYSLGDSCAQAVYFHLEKSFKLNKCNIPYKIKDFTEAIEKIFGPGAKLLEIKIIKRLREKTNISFVFSQKKKDIMFIDYIKILRKMSQEKRY